MRKQRGGSRLASPIWVLFPDHRAAACWSPQPCRSQRSVAPRGQALQKFIALGCSRSAGAAPIQRKGSGWSLCTTTNCRNHRSAWLPRPPKCGRRGTLPRAADAGAVSQSKRRRGARQRVPEPQVGRTWLLDGWRVTVAYARFFVMLAVLGWHPNPPHRRGVELPTPSAIGALHKGPGLFRSLCPSALAAKGCTASARPPVRPPRARRDWQRAAQPRPRELRS